MKKQKATKAPKQPKKQSKGMAILTAVLLVFALVMGFMACSSCVSNSNEEYKAEQEKEKSEEIARQGIDLATAMTIVDKVSDNYIDDYKHSYSEDDWTVAKFDDQGAIMVSTDYTLKDSSIKQPVTCIFTWNPDDQSYEVHFLIIGDNIFINDGYADEFFEKLQQIAGSQQN